LHLLLQWNQRLAASDSALPIPRRLYHFAFAVAVEAAVWQQVIQLYPFLVDCTTLHLLLQWNQQSGSK
jgi:hypothetical protein